MESSLSFTLSCLRFQSRGSDNPNTGPIRDHSSFTSNRVTGAFAYIDASPPRRPNDVAQIVSEEFTATGANRETRLHTSPRVDQLLLSKTYPPSQMEYKKLTFRWARCCVNTRPAKKLAEISTQP